MDKILDKIKGRHWVFIIGFICAMITAIYNTAIADSILVLLLFIGVGLALKSE